MKKKLLLSVFFIAIRFIAFSQAPVIEWEKCFGGTYNEKAKSIIQTTDGGYAVAGFSDSNDGDVTGHNGGPSDDYWIVKINSSGDLEWEKSFGGSSNDEANSIVQTTDGGYVIAGASFSNDGDVTNHHGGTTYADYWIVKLDSAGNMQWQKSYGGSLDDQANSIIQTSDGGFAIAGYSGSSDGDVTGIGGINYWILKLGSGGIIQWQKSYGGTWGDWAQSIIGTADGGYAVAGYTNSSDHDVIGNHSMYNYDYWVMKLNTAGDWNWKKCYGGSSSDGAYSIKQTSEGGFVIAGLTESDDDDVTGHHHVEDDWIVKVDATGSLTWEKALGGFENDYAISIVQSNDGGYVAAGGTASNDGDVSGYHQGYYFTSDYWVVKLDENGNLKWQKCLGGSETEVAYSIINCSDGGFAIAGFASSLDGDVTGNHGGASDFWIVKLFPEITGIQNQPLTSSISIFPNPSSGIFQIQSEQSVIKNVTAFNLLGENIFSTFNFIPTISGQSSTSIALSSQPDGVYFLHLETANGLVVKKVVISR
jgi:hypothetical protein